MKAFRDMNPGEGLDNFHQRCVVPTPQETTGRNAEIDAFVQFLQNEFDIRPYTVARVLKSGSLGKGTAVRGSADIDLVVIMKGVSTIADLKRERPCLLDKLHTAVMGYGPWGGNVELRNKTNYSLCYLLNGQKVDVLPALDIGVCGGKDKVYAAMRSYREGCSQASKEISASLAPLQIDFVEPQGEPVKKVIRLLKFWKKEKGVDIRSYTLELLTIHTYRSYSRSNTEDLFRKVLTRLKENQSLNVIFDSNYPVTYVPDGIICINCHNHMPPSVVDPANPHMNTLLGANSQKISQAAQDMLLRLDGAAAAAPVVAAELLQN